MNWFLVILPALALGGVGYLVGVRRGHGRPGPAGYPGPALPEGVSHEDLAQVAMATGHAVLVMDHERRILWVNEAFVRMTGYTLAEVQGLRPGDKLHGPATDPVAHELMVTHMERGHLAEFEILHYRKDGEPYWALVDVQGLRNAQGRIVKYVSVQREITYLKKTEAAQKLSESRLKEAQELARLGSWELDLVTGCYQASDAALNVYGLAPGRTDVTVAELSHLLDDEGRALVRATRGRAIEELGSYCVQICLHLAGGVERHVEVRGAVHSDDGVRAHRIVGTVQDITDLKRAEIELQRLNESLERRVQERTREIEEQRAFITSVVESAEALVFVLDPQGRFVQFNAACERLTGYSREEVLQRPIWERVIPPERREVARRIHENLSVSDLLTRELDAEWLTRDGRRRMISWRNAMLTDEDGALRFVVVSGVDVTERKLAEQALRAANDELSASLEQLRQAQARLVQSEKLASLGGLVAGISHEVNTPLGSALTSATTLQEDVAALQREYVAGSMRRSALEHFLARATQGFGILVGNLMRAAELVRSFKQVAVDQSSDAPRRIDIARYLDEVVLSLHPNFRGRAIRVRNDSEPGLELVTHPGAISQVVSNLLMNALHHAYAADDEGAARR